MAQARNWCFTLNNPTIDELTLANILEDTTYTIFQLETGENGTPHFQGFVVFPQKKRLTQLRALVKGAHWEIARGTPAQNRDYCSKPDGQVGMPVELGNFSEVKTKGQRTDLKALHSSLKSGLDNLAYRDEFFEQFLRYPNLVQNYKLAGIQARDKTTVPRCFLLIGAPGTGKSRFAEVLADGMHPGRVYRKFPGKWFDGYTGERVIIFDDFRGSSLSFTGFKLLVDRYPFRVELKGTTCEMAASDFVITTNIDPKNWWAEEVTGPELSAIFRRITKILWFGKENSFKIFDHYSDYDRVVNTPRRDGESSPYETETFIPITYPDDPSEAPAIPADLQQTL
nr:MAG: replicase [ssDNA virus sp.]